MFHVTIRRTDKPDECYLTAWVQITEKSVSLTYQDSEGEHKSLHAELRGAQVTLEQR